MKNNKVFGFLMAAAAAAALAGCSGSGSETSSGSKAPLAYLADEAVQTNLERSNLEVLSLNAPIDFSYGNYDTDMLFSMKDGQWMDALDSEIPINQERFQSMADGFLQLKAVSQVGEGKTELAEYGLDHPDYTLYITDGEKGDANISIGSQSENGDYYLSLDDKYIYTVEPALVDSLIFDYNSLVIRDSLDLVVAEEDVKAASVTRDGKTTKFKTSDKELMASIAGALSVLKPENYAVYHAMPQDLSSYGLTEDARTTFTAQIDQNGETKSVTVYVGAFADVDETLCYIQLEDSQMISIVDAEIVAQLLNSAEE